MKASCRRIHIDVCLALKEYVKLTREDCGPRAGVLFLPLPVPTCGHGPSDVIVR
jgi:hypothetical protein